MRHLRWKRNYLSGLSSLDRPKQALYEDLQQLHAEMEHREHCQDMQDLMGDLNAQAKSLFEVKAGSRKQIAGAVSEHAAAISRAIDQQLPLAALDTPACHDCAICDHTEQTIREWLAQAASPDDEEEDFAA